MRDKLRLKALTRLAQSNTEDAKSALLGELNEAVTALETQTDYERLLHSLEVLNVIGYRFGARTVAAIDAFIKTIEGRKLTYSQAPEGFVDYVVKYSNAQSLIVDAVEVIVRLRYYETKAVLWSLLSLFEHSAENVRRSVRSGLESLAKYDLDVFYGADRQGGIGPTPQKLVLDVLESMDEPALKANQAATLMLLTEILSSTLQGVSWTSRTATLSRGVIPAHPTVTEVRGRGIRLLGRLYSLVDSVQQKRAVINALSEGMRIERQGTDEKTQTMIAMDSVNILTFFARLIPSADFPIVQQIESNSYWAFVRASSEDVKAAALKVEAAIARNKEYSIYRTLIGFEGIFGSWSTYERTGEQIEAIDRERRLAASAFAKSITARSYRKWQARILRFARTESDDLATFPVFYHFLGEFAVAQPNLVLRLITEHTREIARFLIPILSALWNGALRDQVRGLVVKWIGEAQPGKDHHLFAATKMFLSTNDLDVELLKQLLDKAAAIKDVASVRQVVAVAIARWESTGKSVVVELFYPALDVLTDMRNASWIFEAWFRKEARSLFAEMDPSGIELVLRNLLVMDRIDYHAEEVLYVLAQRNPERVMQFFVERIAIEAKTRSDGGSRDFDAIPFDFHKLQTVLSKIPEAAVRIVLEQYRADSTLFEYRGATLLKSIFPVLSEEFEAELLRLVRRGDESSIEFVLGVLRNYHGEPFTHRLCKEIIKTVDVNGRLLNLVGIALENTGTVSGEFGIADAYERKRQEVGEWVSDPNEKVRAFAKRYILDLEKMRDAEIKRAQEEIALRKHRFGEQ